MESTLWFHSSWDQLQAVLVQGSNWPLTPLSKIDWQKYLLAALRFGNHKGASDHSELCKNLITAEVQYRFAIPLLLQSITAIPKVLLAPMNIMHHNIINKHCCEIKKDIPTHDQSYR